MAYIVIFWPLNFAFGVEKAFPLLYYLTLVSYFYLAFDFVVTFFTAVEGQNTVVDDLKTIASLNINLRKAFTIVSLVPLDLLLRDDDLLLNFFYRVPRLLLIFRIAFLSRGISDFSSNAFTVQIKQFVVSTKSLFVMRTIILTFLFVHIVACLWVWLLEASQNNWHSRYNLFNQTYTSRSSRVSWI
jgi:hypothetical protein